MEMSEKFINWLEGYLDASKNKLSNWQVKEIRKKITEYHKIKNQRVIPLYDQTNGQFTMADPFMTSQNNSMLNEEFLREVEKTKAASTMEELSAD